MRTITFDVQTEIFNRLPTPSKVKLLEPTIVGEGFSAVTASGEDADLWEYILTVIEKDSPDNYDDYKVLDEAHQIAILNLMEAAVTAVPHNVIVMHFSL